MSQDTKKDWIFAAVVILLHVLFFVLAKSYKRIYMGDSFEYVYEALNIKGHAFFYSGNPVLPIEEEYMTQRQPLYPLFLACFYAIGLTNWGVLIVQNLFSVFNVCFARYVFRRIGYNIKYDWLLLLFVVGYPAQMINADTIAPDILLQTFTLLYFASAVTFFTKRTPRSALWMSIWLICGMMVKPVLYPFSVLHVIILAGGVCSGRFAIRSVVLAAVLPVMAVLAYNYWNSQRTGKFHYSSNQAFNAIFYYYTWFNARVGADSAAKFLERERWNMASINNYPDRYDYGNKRGVELLEQHMLPYLAFHLSSSARMFIEPGKAELDLFTGRLSYGRLYSRAQTGFAATLKNEGMAGLSDYFQRNPSMPVILLVLLANCMRLVGFVLFFLFWRGSRLVKGFIMVVTCYFAIAAGPIANTRYFLPVSLIVMGCAVVGFADYKDGRKLRIR